MGERSAEDYKRVLLYIAALPFGSMAPTIEHFFPTPPERAEYPRDVKPFTPAPSRPRTQEFA